MTSLIWYMIPIALAIALSVFPISAVLLLLLSPDSIRRSTLFACGWSAGLLILVSSFAVGANLIPHDSREHLPPWTHVVEIVLGIVLIAFVLLTGKTSSGKEKSPQIGRNIGPGKSFVFGILMNIRPKNLILTLAAGIAIGAAPISPISSIVIVCIFVVIASSSVNTLVMAYVIGRNKVRPLLEKLRVFLSLHSATMLRIIGLFVGVILVFIGVVQIFSLQNI